MSTLGLSGAVERRDSRLKALFWPTVQNAVDIESLRIQGFWVCQVVAFGAAWTLILQGHPMFAVLMFAFYFLGAMGLREGSLVAATMVFAVYFLDTLGLLKISLLYSLFGALRYIFLAMLLATLRGAWLSRRWERLPEQMQEPAPARLAETWRDHYVDILPRAGWRALRIPFYILGGLVVTLEFLGLIVLLVRSL